MPHYLDLKPCTDFQVEQPDALLAVGWLDEAHEYSTGDVSADFYLKLKELLIDPWQPCVSMGGHECQLCQFDPPTGTRNLFVPDDKILYACPELILHYIAAHRYRPPEQFILAVMSCPPIHSMEYKKQLLKTAVRFMEKSTE